MWQIENHTPFGAQCAFARDRNGAETWLVAVKASYLINTDGSLSIGEPADPLLSPEYFGEPAGSSLKYDSDLQLFKPGTDIILHGHAYPPNDRPVSEMLVSLKAGLLEKTLLVKGDRFFDKNMSSPVPFSRMPLTYENTFGGVDDSIMYDGFPHTFPENPLGTGFALKKENQRGKKAPNIEYVENRPNTPACFAPLPVDWMPRAKYGGTYDEKWMGGKAPLLPDDLDDRFFHCAPWDQQVPGYLKGGEPVEMHGMSPHGPLQFKLPALDLMFKTVLGRKVKEHKARLHTVILEPDTLGFSMVWHTAINCHNQDHMLEKTIIT